MKFSERLTQLGFASYADYLASDLWKGFRLRYKEAGKSMRCAVCSVGPIQLHHQNYDRLGSEWFEDVVPVCGDHHKAIHDWLKSSGRIFVSYTREAIAALQANSSAAPPKLIKKKKMSRRKSKSLKKARAAQQRRDRRAVKELPTLTTSEISRRIEIAKRQDDKAHARIEFLVAKLRSLPLTKKQTAATERFIAANDVKQLRGLVLSIENQRAPRKQSIPPGTEIQRGRWKDPLYAMRMLGNGHQMPPK